MIMAAMLNLWTVRLTTFLLWALAAGSAMFWVLQGVNAASTSDLGAAKTLTSPALGASNTSNTSNTFNASITPQVATALGAKNPIAPTAASALAASQARFQLIGVLAVGSKNGAALIAVDGKPAKPYLVGVAIEDGLEVTSVAARSAFIGSKGAVAFTLELPLKD
jgi:general secretion pathway protein C